MNLAYKFRIYPTKEQKLLFAKTFGCVRFIYNKMLSDQIEYYKETKKKLNNTPAQYKKEYEWLKEADSLSLANAQINLQTAYYGSNRYEKQKHKAALLHEKIANQRKDFLHKASRKIANSYDAVCIENLNRKAMSQALKFGKSVSDNGWGMFAADLTYMR